MSEKNTVALNERDSSSLLSSCGVRMVASVLLDKPDRSRLRGHASRQLGFPVAMKVLSDDILHKTDVGCVVLNVTDVDGMQAAYDTIMANAAQNAPRNGAFWPSRCCPRASRPCWASARIPSSAM